MNRPETHPILKALIIDDEFHGRENLKKIIKTYCPEIDITAVADSAVNAKIAVQKYKPDVVFLDINMPVLDGFDFLSEFEVRDFMVVFVSAHEEFGINAVKAGAVDYLLKPVNIKELKQTIKKLLSIKEKKASPVSVHESEKIILPSSNGFSILETENVVRFEAEGNYTKIINLSEKPILVSRTLKDFEDTVSKEKFFRVHKSHLINVRHVKEYKVLDGYFVIMTDGSRIEISRRKAPGFVQRMKTVINAV